MMPRIPTWILEAEVEKSKKLIDDIIKSPQGKMTLNAAESPAMLALKKLLKDHPRKSEAWYRKEFLALAEADRILQSAIVRDFVRENAASAFCKANQSRK